MAHRHVIGELITEFYVGSVNSDLTEGRGHSVDKGIFTDVKEAHKNILRADVQGTDGDVYYRTYHRCEECPQLIQMDKKVFAGSRWGRTSEFLKDGWHKDFSPLANDPEYKEFVRLQKKFRDLGDSLR